MNSLVAFVRESYEELLHKVSWPKYSELQSNSILVLVASLIFALLIFGIDRVIETVIGWFYSSF